MQRSKRPSPSPSAPAPSPNPESGGNYLYGSWNSAKEWWDQDPAVLLQGSLVFVGLTFFFTLGRKK